MKSLQTCTGCGGIFPISDGPTHKYMISSPACWEAFGRVLAAEYSDTSLWQTHRMSVDTYAVQHPGDGTKRATQSVGLHLARLLVQLEAPRPPIETNEIMLNLGQFKSSIPEFNARSDDRVTIADVVLHAGSSTHAEAVQNWAQSTWQDWQTQHEIIREWVNTHAPELLR